MTDTFRWGILGAGNIARQFATGLQALPDATLVAVGSRSKESADVLGAQFSAVRRHASYEALAADPEVDAIYIATPHSMHRENALLCIEHGKPVLCEKPFAINAAQAEEMVAAARARGVFLMEAMWTRFLPLLGRMRALLAEGAIGEVRMLQADFGFRTRVNPQGRLFDPVLGGGALLDVGVYPVSLASMVLGEPERIVSMADIGSTGVDEQSAIILGYEGGKLALLSTAIRTNTPHEARIMGTEGLIRLHDQWWRGTGMTLAVSGKEPQRIDEPITGNGYNYEAAEVARCVRAGLLESDTMPLDETIAVMRTMDAARAQWGLRYPME
jgi:predicted dehydrogenase